MNTKYLILFVSLLCLTSVGCGDDKKSSASLAATAKPSASSLQFPAADSKNLIAWSELTSGTYIVTGGQALMKASEVNAAFAVSFDYQSNTETTKNTCTPDENAQKNMPASKAKHLRSGFNVGAEIIGGAPAKESSISMTVIQVESDSTDSKKCSVSVKSDTVSRRAPSLSQVLAKTDAKNKIGEISAEGLSFKAAMVRISDSEIRLYYLITSKRMSAAGYFTYSTRGRQ